MDDIARHTADALAAVAGIPADDEGPMFSEPWQAQAFAMTLAMHRAGIFEWGVWSTLLRRHLRAGDCCAVPNSETAYYERWVAVMEAVLVETGITTETRLSQLVDAWNAAAHRTPHGQPIELSPGDFRDSSTPDAVAH